MPSTLVVIGPEVDSQSELMRALPWPRFTSPSGEEVSLPVWAAEALERTEQALRSLGLIGPGEVLCQSYEMKTGFRVKVTDGELSTARRGGKVVHAVVSYDWTREGGEGANLPLPAEPDGRQTGCLPAVYNEWSGDSGDGCASYRLDQ